MIRLAVVGAGGRLGRLILEALPSYSGLELVAAVVSAKSPLAGQPVVNSSRGVLYSTDLSPAVQRADVVIEVARPDVSVEVAQLAQHSGKACLIATTGHSPEQLEAIRQAARNCAILVAANTSTGVYVMMQMAKLAARMLGSNVDYEIVELHHRGKQDAPSGTAKALADAIAEVTPVQGVTQRAGPRLAGEIGLASLRGGDAVGEHTIFFLGDGERIELTHRALNRSLFAHGALRLAEKLATLPPGLKQLSDFFS